MNQFALNRNLLLRSYRTTEDMRTDMNLDVGMHCLTISDGKFYKIVNNTFSDNMKFKSHDTRCLEPESGLISHKDTKSYNYVLFDGYEKYKNVTITKLNNSNIGIIVAEMETLGVEVNVVVYPQGIKKPDGYNKVCIRLVEKETGEELMILDFDNVAPVSLFTGDTITISKTIEGFIFNKNDMNKKVVSIQKLKDAISSVTEVLNLKPRVGILLDNYSDAGYVARLGFGRVEYIVDTILSNGKKAIGAHFIVDDLTIDKTLTVSGTSSLKATTVDGTLGVTGNTSLGGTLGVTGVSSLKATTVDGTLGVTGTSSLKATTVDGTLGVTGNTSLGGTLGVTGTSSLKATTVDGTLGV
ncbi:MAG: hypothetical protein ACRCZ9_11270, partial [Fusobacteriaceae bacterium]